MTLRYHIFFFFNDTATTEIYTLSLHDALPISRAVRVLIDRLRRVVEGLVDLDDLAREGRDQVGDRLHGLDLRSEEHTSELQSRQYLVCRLLLEKKKNNTYSFTSY